MNVLVTGATGIVGAELVEHLRCVPGLRVAGVSSRGDREQGFLAWRMGREACPAELHQEWDVVVNAAASTHWNAPAAAAWRSNVRSTEALEAVVTRATHVVHFSTAYSTGRTGSTASRNLVDYRNSYEWSKAASERAVLDRFSSITIMRPPLVIGRRTDGHVARFNGLYTVLRAIVTGLAPAIVGEPNAGVELVPADDLARLTTAVVCDPPPAEPRVVIPGQGEDALTLAALLTLVCDVINCWRAVRDVTPVEPPPVITPARWERFFFPFAREHFSARQLRVVQLLDEFRPYLDGSTSIAPNAAVGDIAVAVETAVRHWADAHSRVALGAPKSWRSSDG